MSAAGLNWFESIIPIAILLFCLGLGWNMSFVAATTQLADLSSASERGKLLGFNDFVAGTAGSIFVIVGGIALDGLGVAALALGAGAIALLPIPFLLLRRPATATG